MASRYEISCIVKSTEPQQSVTHIAGVNEFGNQWKLPVERAIMGIEQRDWDFYVSKEGRQISIVVGQQPSGEKYIKTADVNLCHLWDLPQCTF